MLRGRGAAEIALGLAQHAWARAMAAADAADTRRWLERAHRIAPMDGMVALRLAACRLAGGDVAGAAELFAVVAERFDHAEAKLGLAASALRLGDPARAAAAMQAALSRHAVAASYHPLAAAVAAAAGRPGWCALTGAGRLQAGGPAALLLDGEPLKRRWTGGGCRIPHGRSLQVQRDGVGLLGSPIDLAAIGRVEGVVEAQAGGVAGWAWHPGDPDRDPVLQARCTGGSTRRILARHLLANQVFAQPGARLRQFRFAGLPGGAVNVAGADGRALLGSPLNPELAASPEPAVKARTKTTPSQRPAIDVIVPVHGGREAALACLHSVLPTLPPGSRLHVVDDASPDPALAAALDAMAGRGQIILHRLADNLGFPGAANTGLRASAGRDAVLLNSDTLTPPGWLQALADAAYSATDIGSACPLSNDATILSYPNPAGGNPMLQPEASHALAHRANGAATVDIPVSVGFCMYIRRDCLAETGLLREDVFAQGYGEENDWCLRARQLGWRHVAAAGCFVAHAGGASFGAARHHLLRRNSAILERLHPGYFAMIEAWIAADPLGPARRRMDALRWRQEGGAAVVLVTHAAGGGVERVVAAREAALLASGLRPIVLRPDAGAVRVGDGDTPNLRYHLPAEWPALLRLLRAGGAAAVELHHMLGHPPALAGLAARLGVPQDMVIHDYAGLCPRIALVRGGAYCGEPPVATCRSCVAEHGSYLEEPIDPAALRARSAAQLGESRRVCVPSEDAARRLRRHFPDVRPVVTPWEDDEAILPPAQLRRPVRHVGVPGAIGLEKGYAVLLACVRDAAARRLDLRFTVIGHTDDDETLLEAGPVFITGRYGEAEAAGLIRAQGCDAALLPSIWPETWCFTLGLAWRAGLPAIVFDIGAQADRVRRTGWGRVLPLAMTPRAINDWLIGDDTEAIMSDELHHNRQKPSPLFRFPAI